MRRERFSNITGSYRREMEWKLFGPESWDRVSRPMVGALLSFIGQVAHLSSWSGVRHNFTRRSVALWAEKV